MAFQVSPGINVTEIDLTTIVPAVATTVGGIAGYYEWGPADRVVLIDTPNNYRKTFGDPKVWNYSQWFTGTNFLGYGRSLLVVRKTLGGAKNAVGSSVYYTGTNAIDGSLTGVIGITFASSFASGLTTVSNAEGNKVFFAPGTADGSGITTTVTGPMYFSLTVDGISITGTDGFVTFNTDDSAISDINPSHTSDVYEFGTITLGDYTTVDTNSKILTFFNNYDSFVAATADGILGYTGATGDDIFEFDASDSETTAVEVQEFAAGNTAVYVTHGLTWTAGDSFAGNGPANEPRYIPNSSGLTSSDYYGIFAKYPGEKGNSLKVSLFLGGNTDNYENWTWYKTQNIIGEAPSVEGSDNLNKLVGQDVNDLFHMVVIDEDGLFTGQRDTVLERYANVSIFPQSKTDNGTSNYYKSIINNASQYVFFGGSETPDDSVVDFEKNIGLTAGTITVTNTYKVAYPTFFDTNSSTTGSIDISLIGGTGSGSVNSSVYTQGLISSVPSSSDPSGYNLFEDTENVNVSLIMGGAIEDSTQLSNLRQLAEYRKDCVVFVSSNNKDDSATETTKQTNCITTKNNVGSSSYVFIDSGYKYQYDQYNDRYRWIPLNGDTSGLVARTDLTNDPWFSPAGLNRGQIRNAVKLAFNPSKTFRDAIYPKGINPVISVPGEGTILFGDRTALSKPSAFDRINVRRLFIVLEKAIAAASKFSLFEFNDAFTRQQFKNLVEPFLRDVKARRGIFDWKVVCDETNNTPEMIDRNEFAADIYIKPTRTINYIQLNFIATRTGVSFDEVGA